MSYRYRCGRCRTTSPYVHSRTALDQTRRDHRDQFHGGHIPDGEKLIEERFSHILGVPRHEFVAGALVFGVLAILLTIRFW